MENFKQDNSTETAERMPGYVAAVLSPESRQKLFDYVRPSYPNVYSHHMTISYKPEVAEYDDMVAEEVIGSTQTLKITKIIYSPGSITALVDNVDCKYIKNKHPHITIATAEGVPPKFSNEFLAHDADYEEIDVDLDLDAKVEFVGHQ